MTSSEAQAAPSARPTVMPLATRARKALGRVRRRFALDVYDFFVCRSPRAGGELTPVPPPPDYTLRWATAEEVLAADPFHTELDGRERRAGAARIGLGHRCVGAFHGDLLVFTMWENPRCANVPGLLKRRLAPDQSFLYKAYTSPEHRGRKLYQAGLSFTLQAIEPEGKREVVGYAHVKKAASRAGLARVGFHTVGRVRQLRVPGLQRTFCDADFQRAFPEVVARSGAVPREVEA